MPEKHDPSMDPGPTTRQLDPVHMLDALPAGTQLGDYQILETLGRGGFGIVYLALDPSLQRKVAIKEYFPAALAMRCNDGQVWMKPGADPMAYSSGMKAFLNEAGMLACFDHPSLVRVHAFWEENRSAYMVMPYYEGRTLAEVLAERTGPADEAWLRSLLEPLLGALSTLHNAHCLHLDISPDNILLLADGRPVLLDFGGASRPSPTDKTMPLTALLNPAYAPIEQYSESANLQQGPWSDLYALAGVLHFAIAGVPPARATVRALDDPQRPLAETVAARAQQFPGLSYSTVFLAAIDKALAVRPHDRPCDVAEFQALLDQPPSPQAVPPAFDFAAATRGSTHGMATPTPVAASETWFSAEPMDAPPRSTRSRAPVWIVTIAVIGLAAAGWTWLQRQPSFATITVSDLPPAVVANVPKPAAQSASTVAALPTEPTAAGPASSAASAEAATETKTEAAITIATTATASAPASASTASTPTLVAAPAATPKTHVAKAAEPRVSPLPPEPATPQAACGSRSNFALVYCMQQQCKRDKFSKHPQCLEFQRRGEP